MQELRARNQGCDVILITAARDVDTLQQAMRGGVVDYLLKPVVFPRLEAALKKYVVQKHQFTSASDLDQNLVDKMLQSPSTAESSVQSCLRVSTVSPSTKYVRCFLVQKV